MTITPPPKRGMHIPWVSARPSRQRESVPPEPRTGARWLACLAHPSWTGLGVIVSTLLALSSFWLALTS